MADATRSQLEQAYRLIQQDKLDQAIAILKPITSAQPDNADAWWLMANAVSEPEEAHNALEQVLRLNPGHSQARELKGQLESEFPQVAKAGSTSEFGDVASFDDLFADKPSAQAPVAEPSGSSSFTSDDIDSLFKNTPSSGFSEADEAVAEPSFTSSADMDSFFDSSQQDVAPSSAPAPAFDEDPFGTAEPTFVQAGPLDEAAAKPAAKGRPKREKQPKEPKAAKVAAPKAPLSPLELERRANARPNRFAVFAYLMMLVIIVGAGVLFAFATGLIGKPAAQSPEVAAAVQAINGLFTANKLQSASSATVQTASGSALQVQFCGEAGPDLSTSINKAMDIVAQGASTLRNSIKAAGVQVVSCAQPDVVLFRALAPMDAIATYVDGGMKDARTYHASWEHNTK